MTFVGWGANKPVILSFRCEMPHRYLPHVRPARIGPRVNGSVTIAFCNPGH